MPHERDMFYANDGRYIQIMTLLKETGSVHSYFHLESEREKALEHYNMLKEESHIEVIWIEGRKIDPDTYRVKSELPKCPACNVELNKPVYPNKKEFICKNSRCMESEYEEEEPMIEEPFTL